MRQRKQKVADQIKRGKKTTLKMLSNWINKIKKIPRQLMKVKNEGKKIIHI